MTEIKALWQCASYGCGLTTRVDFGKEDSKLDECK